MNVIQEDIQSSSTSTDHSEDPSDFTNHRITRFRFLRAFGVTFGILIDLGFFHVCGKFFGDEWENSRRPAVYSKNARRLKKLLLSLQGIFIKAGQLISILSNFLPDYFRKELEELQDKIPPRPLSEIIERIHKELGKDPSLLFAEFDPNAIASASLAQVHLVRLQDGRRVAVKVQYLDIEANTKKDLQTIKQLLTFYGFFSKNKRSGLSAQSVQPDDPGRAGFSPGSRAYRNHRSQLCRECAGLFPESDP